MIEKTEPPNYEEIEHLVQNEIDQALEKFRAGDFEVRVRRRLATEEKPARKRASLLLKVAVPAAAVLMLTIAAVVYFSHPGRGPVQAPIDARAIAAVLRELPSFSGQALDLATGPAGGAATPEDKGAIASVLGAAGAGIGAPAGPGPARADVLKTAPLTMKKRMEILFKDKVIERVLMLWAAKAKEA